MSRSGKLVWTGLKGRNGWDSPLALPDDEAVELYNIDITSGELGAKRAGSTSTLGTTSTPDTIVQLIRHVPGPDDTASELWAFYNTTPFSVKRLAGGTAWAAVTTIDTSFVSNVITGASLNGKLFLTNDSSVNRLHVWDGTRYRRVGMAQGGTATTANTGSGTYPATGRYYRIAWIEKSGAIVVRRGELGPAVFITPSGTGTAIRVTLPTPPGENETHWEIYASPIDTYSTYQLIATVVIGTTTYDDTTLVANYAGNAPSSSGTNIPPPSAKYIISTANRLLMAGAWETTAVAGQTAVKNNRVWYTRVLGSSDQGDDESIPDIAASGLVPAQKNWIDVGENDGGGAVTGLGSLGGLVYAFKARQVWQLIPTGDDLQPYRAMLVSKRIGTYAHHSIVEGEDESGAPALYFFSHRGPYRITVDGRIQYCGRDIEDLASVAAVASYASTWGLYHHDKRQLWFYFTFPGGSAAPLVINTVTEGRPTPYGIQGGWARYTVQIGAVSPTGVMFSNTPGASMSADLRPYIALAGSSASLVKYGTGVDDSGTLFQAFIESKVYFPAGAGLNVTTDDAVLIAGVSTGATVHLTTIRDFGLETRHTSVLLTADGPGQTRVLKRLDDSGMSNLGAVQFRLGDFSLSADAWTLDALTLPYTMQEPRS